MIFPQEFESKIGFDQIREKLKSYCLSPLGMTEVDGLGFLTDYSSVKELLNQSHEFKKLLIKAEPFPASNYFDPTDLFQTIKIEESFIEEDGFRIILLSLQTIFDCKQFLDKSKEEYPNLYQLSIDINLPKNLLSSIQSKFDEKGKIRDNATPELNRIRRQLREEEGKVRRLTEQIFRSAASQSWVPEGASPTIREGRLVIPVLAEHKRKVKGFIVDESATGQTIYLEPLKLS